MTKGQKEEPVMAYNFMRMGTGMKYEVQVSHTLVRKGTIRVDADNPEEAEQLACQLFQAFQIPLIDENVNATRIFHIKGRTLIEPPLTHDGKTRSEIIDILLEDDIDYMNDSVVADVLQTGNIGYNNTSVGDLIRLYYEYYPDQYCIGCKHSNDFDDDCTVIGDGYIERCWEEKS